jgi:hypothetical protein
MKHSPSWKVDIRSVVKKFRPLLWILKGRHRFTLTPNAHPVSIRPIMSLSFHLCPCLTCGLHVSSLKFCMHFYLPYHWIRHAQVALFNLLATTVLTFGAKAPHCVINILHFPIKNSKLLLSTAGVISFRHVSAESIIVLLTRDTQSFSDICTYCRENYRRQ